MYPFLGQELLKRVATNPKIVGPLLISAVGAQKAEEIQGLFSSGKIPINDIYSILTGGNVTSILNKITSTPSGSFSSPDQDDIDRQAEFNRGLGKQTTFADDIKSEPLITPVPEKLPGLLSTPEEKNIDYSNVTPMPAPAKVSDFIQKSEEDSSPVDPVDIIQIKTTADQAKDDSSPVVVDPKEYSPKMKMARPFEYVETVNTIKIFGNDDVRKVTYTDKKAAPIKYTFSEDKLEEIKNNTLLEFEQRTGTNVKALVDKVGFKMPDLNTLNNSLKRDEAARYWYERSSEYFDTLLEPLSKEDKSKFLNILSITSGGVTPKENFKIALGVYSDYKAGRPIRMGFRQTASLDKLLKDPGSQINSSKFRNFTDSFGYFMGTTDRPPNTVNDLQMADIFGIDQSALASNPDLYSLMTMSLTNLANEVNEITPEGQELLQPYQLQSILWTENRGGQSTNYAEVGPEVIDNMRKLGYEFKDDKLNLEEITSANFVRSIQKTVKPYEDSVKMTIESGSFLTPSGMKIKQLVDNFSDDTVLMDQISKINKSANSQLITRKNKQPSIVEKLFSVAVGSNVSVSRMQKGFGTFEGQIGDNIIIPSVYKNKKGEIIPLTPDQRINVMAFLGKYLNQEAAASSNFTSIEPGEGLSSEEIEEGKKLTNTFYVPETGYSTNQFKKVLDQSGYEFNIFPVPGGFLLDTLSFDGKPDTEKVGNAILDVFGKDKVVEIVDSKWYGEYIGKELYEERENAFKKSIAERMGEEGDSLESFNDLLPSVEEVSEVDKNRDQGYDEILGSTKVINLLKGANIQLKRRGGYVMPLPEIPSLVKGGLVDINYLTRSLNNGR